MDRTKYIGMDVHKESISIAVMNAAGKITMECVIEITGVYEEKIRVWQEMVDIDTAFIEGPKPGVDYSKLEAEIPKLRANLDFIDQALFQSSPAIFGTLIDLKADSQGHASHLIITKAERQNLIEKLKTAFGSKLDQKNQNYIVSSASVLKAYLLKDWKASDEPWE